MTKSNIISKNFAKSATTYDTNAYFQKYAAKKLLSIIKKEIKDFSPHNIFEIGCGTGFLTKLLLTLFKDNNFIISDISEEMLNETIANTATIAQNVKNVDYKLCDVTGVLPNKSFDLITSGLTFQWLEDSLSKSLERLKDILSDNGYIVFSTLTDKTFHNFRLCFEELNISYPGPELLSYEKIEKECQKHFSSVSLFTEIYTESYSSINNFLKRIKLTGAGNPNKEKISAVQLKKIMKLYTKKFANDTKTEIKESYELCIVILKK